MLGESDHVLCDAFMEDLKKGMLSALHSKVANDDTLMIALRSESINLYYRGGSLMRLKRLGDRRYVPQFDTDYGEELQALIQQLPPKITKGSECDAWVLAFPMLKDIMNVYFAKRPKSEREFQQLVVWENNRSSLANETDYFITDIEFTNLISDIKTMNGARRARTDMLALKLRARDHKLAKHCAPVLIEMKWGDGAYGGTAGIKKHIEDIDRVIGNEKLMANIRNTIAKQFKQLNRLDMLRCRLGATMEDVDLFPLEHPEVVFILANHNPRSKILHSILETIEEPNFFNLRFFVASFSGYGMHEACMLDLSQFKKRLGAI